MTRIASGEIDTAQKRKKLLDGYAEELILCLPEWENVQGIFWLRGQDLNLRPSGYEPDELPGCSTPRYYRAFRLPGFLCLPVLMRRCAPFAVRRGCSCPALLSSVPVARIVCLPVLMRCFAPFGSGGAALALRYFVLKSGLNRRNGYFPLV
jgi:hypothetical protein